MYAGDLVIASEDIDEMQNALSALTIWCDANDMIVNTSKTKTLKFRKAGAQGKKKLYIKHKEIEFVTSFKYLGITMQPALGFSEHVTLLQARTAKTIICLGNQQKVPLTLAMRIFKMKS